MTSTYQPYRPGALLFPGLAEPEVKSPFANKPLLLAAAVTGGVSAALLVWAILPSAARESSAEVASVPAVAPADPGAVPAENQAPPVPVAPAPPPPPPVPAAPVPAAPVPAAPVPAAPVPAPAPPVAVPVAPPEPGVITFDTGAPQCFPFQPDC